MELSPFIKIKHKGNNEGPLKPTRLRFALYVAGKINETFVVLCRQINYVSS